MSRKTGLGLESTGQAALGAFCSTLWDKITALLQICNERDNNGMKVEC